MEIDLKNKLPTSIKDVCEIFWNLESELDLLDLEVQNVKIWQIIRFRVYRYLIEVTNIQEQGHTKLSKIGKLKLIVPFIFHSIIHNPFLKKTCDIIVLSHPRPKQVGNRVIDIYTQYFIDELEKNHTNYLELEHSYLGKHLKDKNKNYSYTDFIVLMANIIKKLSYINMLPNELKLIKEINNSLSKSFNMKIDISPIFIDNIKSFKVKRFLYKRLFRKLNAKKLYLCTAYDNPDIVCAAKEEQIEVIEFQHGVFSAYHLGYSYPNREKELDCFPDKFLVWNQYWKDLIQLPIPYQNIEIKPFQYLLNSKAMYKDEKKIDQLIVISQGGVGNLIAHCLVEKIALFSKLKIIYKLHPGEYDRYHTYKDLKTLQLLHPNIELVEEADLHQLQAKSKYQIGVNSTALYEGVEFGCETLLLDIPGIEYMDKFINFYNLHKHDNLYLSQNCERALDL